ncbi:cupredoxin domain-containing protein [Natronorubrum sulfidifaciens]|uniref:Blue (Type 1) copper domain-containing protein n=1 Tax=Natronorubrum sulfidifaciens JCM 14089 TaxID=1230460 RepID=L9WGV4_9EURY|nr:plastocyanin/azurin family copper-binding protein [Natronorubrum sulfidifaciens]ELY47548.1 blue (type 1) copper domain-containing protein [Natronorubrum sulfidifaciens JCM 14089]
MAEETRSRRGYLKYAGAISGIALSGCLNDDADASDDDSTENDETDDEQSDEHEVIAGPDGDWEFDPEELTIAVGDTVTWYFDSPGHNVTSHPDADNACENPEGAEPFTSYDGDNHNAVVEEGGEFEHTFEVAGEYVYVCTPHTPQMAGEIYVEE